LGKTEAMTNLSVRAVQRLTLAAACLAQGMMVLDVLIVSVALPSMQRELGLSPSGLEWVVSSYALVLAALIPSGGALGDHFGRKRIFVAGLALFTLASVGCALSASGGMLIAFRVVQGIGGAVMSSLTLALISEAYPPDARSGPIGLWAAVSGLAVAGGSVVGGLLLSVFPWSSIFWVNVPIGVLAIAISVIGVTESRESAPRPLDVRGVALSALGLFLVAFGLVYSADAGWGSPAVAGCIVAGVAVLAAFAAWERRTRSPMAPPALLRTRSFAAACGVYLLAYLAFSGFIYYVTLYFQNVQRWSALHTGLSWLLFCIPYFAVAQRRRQLARWLPEAAAVGWGCVIAAVGTLAMSQLTTTTTFALPAVSYVLVGVGFGLMVPAGSAAAMAEVPADSSGIGSGLFNACRQIGTAMGLAILGSIATSIIVADWRSRVHSFAPAGRSGAGGLSADVAGGQIKPVTAELGEHAHGAAVASFLHGFEAALIVASVILIAAAALGFLGLRRLRPLPHRRWNELRDGTGHRARAVDRDPRAGAGNRHEGGIGEVGCQAPGIFGGKELARLAPDHQDRPAEPGDRPGRVDEELRALTSQGRDEIIGHPPVAQHRPEERLGAFVVEPFLGHAGDVPAPGGQANRPPRQPGHPAAHGRRHLELGGRELVVAFAVGQHEMADPRECRMAGGEGQQQEAAGRVVRDHGGVGHVEQVQAVEQQPRQRGGRPVCS
jgi:MFS transporter, DHA2 family, methylenomycin A resistance protein